MADPSNEVCPDFNGDAYTDIREDIRRATGGTQEAVVLRLSQSWTIGHNQRVNEWNLNRERELADAAEADQARAAQEDEARAQQEAEDEREKVEVDKKKPKMNGFNDRASVGDALAPRPSQYATQKLNNFEYIELWYFSPDGCKEALRTARSVADDFGLTRVDDQLTIRPAYAFKASKAAIADHDLPFSTFLRSKNLFLMQLSKAKWPQTHIDALSLFFWRLENHSIRDHSDLGDLVILHYASRVRQDWHDRLKRDEAFNIAIINEVLLRSINEELWDKVRSQNFATVRFLKPRSIEPPSDNRCIYLLTLTPKLFSFVNVSQSLPASLLTRMPARLLMRMPTNTNVDARTLAHADARTPAHTDARTLCLHGCPYHCLHGRSSSYRFGNTHTSAQNKRVVYSATPKSEVKLPRPPPRLTSQQSRTLSP